MKKVYVIFSILLLIILSSVYAGFWDFLTGKTVAGENLVPVKIDYELILFNEADGPPEPYADEFVIVSFHLRNDGPTLSVEDLNTIKPTITGFKKDQNIAPQWLVESIGYNGVKFNRVIDYVYTEGIPTGGEFKYGMWGYFSSSGDITVTGTLPNGASVSKVIKVLNDPGCYDSDEGKPDVAGWSIGVSRCVNQEECHNTRVRDNCEDSKTLSEYFCDDGFRWWKQVNCEHECLGAACVGPIPKKCSDSDGGKNYDVQGTVKGIYGGIKCFIDDFSGKMVCPGEDVELLDYCNKDDNNYVDEYYCDDGRIKLLKYAQHCGLGCENGACYTPPEPEPEPEEPPVEEQPPEEEPEEDIPVDISNLEMTILTEKDVYSVNEEIKLTQSPDTTSNLITGQVTFESMSNVDFKQNQFGEGSFGILEQGSGDVKGYIIELKEKPLVVKKKELEITAQKNEEKIESMSKYNPVKYVYKAFSIQSEDVPDKLEDHKEEIASEREKAKNRIKKKLNVDNLITGQAIGDSDDIEVLDESENVVNSIVLDITAEEADEIKDLKEVKSVYPNRLNELYLMDSVPLINADDVWLLDEDGNNCEESGNECLTGKGVTIAIIDTGVDYTHPDLGGCFGPGCKVIAGYDFSDSDNNPMDFQGHGTHVAATAAGNGVLKGVAPDAEIYAYKVFPYAYDHVIIAAIEAAMDPNGDGDYSDHVDIISMSLGKFCGGTYTDLCNPDDVISTAVDNAVDAGVVVVVAAGNSGPNLGTVSSPATARKAITVGATYKKDYSGDYWGQINPIQDQVTSFSSRGPVIWTDTNGDTNLLTKPDILGPGAIVCAARYDSIFPEGSHPFYKPCFDEEHVQLAGTSMSTPIVSGAVALLIQKNPDWTPEDIKNSMIEKDTSLSA